MSDDLLTTARGLLAHSRFTSATAYAAVDAAETLRRIEGLLDVLAGRTITVDALRERMAPAHAPTGTAAGDPSPPPAADDTPQVGEVWEDDVFGRVTISDVKLRGSVGFTSAKGPGYVDLPHLLSHWRRVSPAPAPLAEREVTAEAQAQDGVEPASDDYAQALDDLTSRALDAEARAERAEAQVALMAPVVRVATAPAVTAGALADAARAYREATRDA